jgi:hypothetical protein
MKTIDFFARRSRMRAGEVVNARVVLRQDVMNRAKGSRNAYACAVNTITHEWTHAVQTAPGVTAFRFTDEAHANALKPLVAYTYGALAQCMTLTQPFNGAPGLDVDLPACVQEVGTTTFNPSTCDWGWIPPSKALATGRTSKAMEAP